MNIKLRRFLCYFFMSLFRQRMQLRWEIGEWCVVSGVGGDDRRLSDGGARDSSRHTNHLRLGRCPRQQQILRHHHFSSQRGTWRHQVRTNNYPKLNLGSINFQISIWLTRSVDEMLNRITFSIIMAETQIWLEELVQRLLWKLGQVGLTGYLSRVWL